MNWFYVYVIELRPRYLGKTTTGKPDVYVGYSAFTPEERFRKHQTEPRASRHVRQRGLRLLPRLYEGWNPIPSRRVAKIAEQRMRQKLEAQGYKVYGSCSPRQTPHCWL